MADYLPYKKRDFKLQKDAVAWTKEIKKDYGGAKKLRIETNYNPTNPLPWQGVVLMKDEANG